MKILFIRYKKPGKILEGGEQVSQKNYDAFARLLGQENVTPYYIHDENSKSIFHYIVAVFYFFFNYFFGLTKKRAGEIVKLASGYDIVFIDRSVFGILTKHLKENNYKGKIITFFHNVEKIYFADKISMLAPWRFLILHCADKNDEYACRYSDKIIALNERDAGEIEKRYHRIPDLLIPVSFKDVYKQDAYPHEKTSVPLKCLFIGSYFPANSEGIKWFIQEVFPFVDVHLQIVGKGMNLLKKDLNIPQNAELIADVPDLKPYFETADVVILPIFKGSGMKVKTCEALMYGKNIIGTTEAFEGYEVDYDLVGGRCNTKNDFIEKIQQFISFPRPRFNAYSRKMFLEKYSEQSVEIKFRNLIEF
ncbi:MAG: glycosyltransferase family 4 protein [Prevotellaceae bacterium]|jgi:hypothetical protein|nr:glycosyltransferase family 4 protein [Prevotellaceae bacterium]